MSTSTGAKLDKKLAIAVLVVLCLLSTTGSKGWAQPVKFVVIPFTMNSPQDLGYLRNGLFTMLYSRLSNPGSVSVVNRGDVDKALAEARAAKLISGAFGESEARVIGERMGVDFVLCGSVTHVGDSISLDAQVVNVSGKGEGLSFFDQSKNMGDVLSFANNLAQDINHKLFGRPMAARAASASSPAASGNARVQPVGQQTQPSAITPAVPRQGSRGGFNDLFHFDDVIRAMAAGDLKHDGAQRIVAATDSALYIFRLQNGRLVQEDLLDYSSTNLISALDVADINGNGYPEIFVTAMNIHRDGLQSFVVEYDGSGYRTVLEDQSLYYRVIQGQNGPVLLSQDRGRNPFDGHAAIMVASGNGYGEKERLALPRQTSILSCERGNDLAYRGGQYFLLNRDGRLLLSNESGRSVWKGSEKYGTTRNFWLMPPVETDASYRERAYLHPRLLFYDVDGDGKKELFVVKNHEFADGTLGRYKRFKEGQVEMLSWNGASMIPSFKTPEVPGWISDYAVTDLDGDGRRELVISAVSGGKLALLAKDDSSSIVSFALEK